MPPLTPEQLERWARPHPQPVRLELYDGWQQQVSEPDPAEPNQKHWWYSQGARNVELMRTWDQPLEPGLPMQIASKRTVMVAQRPVELQTTSMFQGRPWVVQLLWLEGRGHQVKYSVRLCFTDCPDALVDEVLRCAVVAW